MPDPAANPTSSPTLPNRASSLARKAIAAGIVLALALAFILPRSLSLGSFVTADEPTWAKRAASFYFALGQQDYAETYQTGHPGVTTMWAGVLAYWLKFPDYQRVGQLALGDTKLLQIFQKHGPNSMEYMATARLAVVIIVTIAMLAGLYFIWKLFGWQVAALAFVLIAFDPFYVAHSRFLHTNGMLATFMFVSVLAFLCYLQTRSFFDLASSGMAAGLAFVCISPGFLLIPVVGLFAGISLWDIEQRRFDLRASSILKKAVIPVAVWGVIAVALIYLIWPAMWSNPAGTLIKTLRYGMSAAEGEIGGAQFVEAYQDADKGSNYLYFYPLTYLWRSTPVSLIGVIFSLIFLVAERKTSASSASSQLLRLLLFIVIYTALMSLGSKKFDRYYLPVYLPLDILAAWGWLGLARWLAARLLGFTGRAAALGALAAIVAIQLVSTLQNVPYYLTYYNPLLGGLKKAPGVMTVGWGEGLNEAALYLRQRGEACDREILSWYPLAYTWYSIGFDCEAQLVEFRPDMTLTDYLAYDYIVIYINQIQRDYPRDLLVYLSARQPEHTVWIKGVEYARIYKLSN